MNGKQLLNIVYSLGASIVLVGALFKILHLPGADVMLTVGLLTEAGLFLLGAFEKPAPSYHWENVWPEVLEKQKKGQELLQSTASNGVDATTGMANFSDSMSQIAAYTEEAMQIAEDYKHNMERASDSFGRVSDTIGAVDESFAEFNGEVSRSIDSVRQFTTLNDSLSSVTAIHVEKLNEVESSLEHGIKNLTDAQQVLVDKVASINALYELQIEQVKQASENMQYFSQSAIDITEKITETANVYQNTYHTSKELEEKVSSLNSVYGNMLSSI